MDVSRVFMALGGLDLSSRDGLVWKKAAYPHEADEPCNGRDEHAAIHIKGSLLRR
ncbi:MAG: hypothetical protein JRH08_02075 [Deltaproteobacteria bacterium]|nr:hypothetical protein [Deltaproteobacteria bacterium]MBW2025020.1 hypothetical protein [Deltaproteobacteria bacterium]MBW2124486.1 hypothetical protein [Deltaproteobacteria bacterium]